MSNSQIEVSVCIVTYNQADYIEKCLESVLEQVTDFDFEIIIGDDYSTDGTRKILESFKASYPHINIVFRDANIGASKNFLDIHSRATGKYVCHLDGDDYWLPGKLQKQYEFMENNLDCYVSWTRMYIYDEVTSRFFADSVKVELHPSSGFTVVDLIKGIGVGQHSSKMYRNSFKKMYSPDFGFLDLLAHIQNLDGGKSMYVSDEALGVYREGVGISSNDKTSFLLANTLSFLSKHHEDYRNAISVRALIQCFVALKLRKINVFSMFLKIWVKNFTFTSFFEVIKMNRKNSLYKSSKGKKSVNEIT
ncbi:glycosyltransferase family 2 protein [Shewanella algae]|uniref:glycosyltransferase family 2 protein n=1 Tax=Shewanella algae TaxID=38313 RepID=UPI0011826E1A|nr:glycosyltransferase family 2 protein [Shewanella algae]TVP08403.1 hypothetical protein AYI73_00630 [Shewanella algae]BCV40208.1 glycosyl transferase [Shewanella algae]